MLERYDMQDYKSGDTPVKKNDKFSLSQCPKNGLEVKEMQKIPYASTVGSLMYAQVCTRADITFIVRMLGGYLSNPGMDHTRAAKRVFSTCLHIRGQIRLRSLSLQILTLLDAKTVGDPHRANLSVSWRSCFLKEC